VKRPPLLLELWGYSVLGLAVAAFAGGLGVGFDGPSCRVTPHRVDLQRAGVDELTVLPGIGRARAEAIVLARVRFGPFRTVDDLCRVEGLGVATVQAIRAWVTVGRDER
jgi:competence protein ComEA